MKTQLSKSADQKIRTKGILCAQMREIKRKNTLDRKSNVEKTLILSRVFLFWIRGVRNQCFPTAPSVIETNKVLAPILYGVLLIIDCSLCSS